MSISDVASAISEKRFIAQGDYPLIGMDFLDSGVHHIMRSYFEVEESRYDYDISRRRFSRDKSVAQGVCYVDSVPSFAIYPADARESSIIIRRHLVTGLGLKNIDSLEILSNGIPEDWTEGYLQKNIVLNEWHDNKLLQSYDRSKKAFDINYSLRLRSNHEILPDDARQAVKDARKDFGKGIYVIRKENWRLNCMRCISEDNAVMIVGIYPQDRYCTDKDEAHLIYRSGFEDQNRNYRKE